MKKRVPQDGVIPPHYKSVKYLIIYIVMFRMLLKCHMETCWLVLVTIFINLQFLNLVCSVDGASRYSLCK
jgi:hypothetical protein